SADAIGEQRKWKPFRGIRDHSHGKNSDGSYFSSAGGVSRAVVAFWFAWRRGDGRGFLFQARDGEASGTAGGTAPAGVARSGLAGRAGILGGDESDGPIRCGES